MADNYSFTAKYDNMERNTRPMQNSSLQVSYHNDLRGLLELLNTTTDLNLLIKLFSALSAHLIFYKDTNLDSIIKCSAIYNRIHNVLKKGLPRKATFALNFLSALLYVDAEECASTHRKTLAMYAKNMTRTSGCLDVMTDLFTNCMMYHDTWQALCQCLAAACSGNEANQSYCTHLIPACIRKCSQTNMDIFILLQSLVLNHKQNMQLFLDYNGSGIFIRELLHYDKCLQLLTTVVQCSDATQILRSTNVIDDLRDFLRLYGLHSQIGQKAKIILNHIELRSKGMDSHNSNMDKEKPQLLRELRNDVSGCKEDESDNTQLLMQNVMKEIFDYKRNEHGHIKKSETNTEVNALIRGASAMNLNVRNCQTRPQTMLKRSTTPLVLAENNCNSTELSFTYLKNMYKEALNNNFKGNAATNKSTRSNAITTDKIIRNDKAQTSVYPEKITPDLYGTLTSNKKPTSIDLNDFSPIYSSTPKHNRDNSKKIDYSKIITNTILLKANTTRRSKIYKTCKVKKTRPKNKELSKDKVNRSMSSRFFSAINDSCTTLVKTVANIFKKKESTIASDDYLRSQSSTERGDQSCSYSFLKYMQKRDAVLNYTFSKKEKWNKDSDFSVGTKSCETCDDTEILKQKLATDKHLKRTVKKLKLGINLYGCDFKKISRTMWSRESYMTPVVLYNLYRKLLLK